MRKISQKYVLFIITQYFDISRVFHKCFINITDGMAWKLTRGCDKLKSSLSMMKTRIRKIKETWAAVDGWSESLFLMTIVLK